MLEAADIFRDLGPAYRARNAGHLSLGQLRVMSAIECCRTLAYLYSKTDRMDLARAQVARREAATRPAASQPAASP